MLRPQRTTRRHRPLLDDLLDHGAVNGDVFIVGQRKRGNATVAMAFDAVALHDPRNAVVVGLGDDWRRFEVEVELAAGSVGRCNVGTIAGQ